jgi:hypothetical protein
MSLNRVLSLNDGMQVTGNQHENNPIQGAFSEMTNACAFVKGLIGSRPRPEKASHRTCPSFCESK